MIWKAGICAAALCWPPRRGVAETPVERGEYLVRGPMGCGNCHTPQGPEGPGMARSRRRALVDRRGDVQAVLAPNITPAGRDRRLVRRGDRRAIREGIRPDGSLIGPPMPFISTRTSSDDDLAAIVAYLRTRPGVENDGAKSAYNFPLPPAYGPPVEHVADAPRAADRRVRRLPGRPDRALHRVPHPDGSAGPDAKPPSARAASSRGPWGVWSPRT